MKLNVTPPNTLNPMARPADQVMLAPGPTHKRVYADGLDRSSLAQETHGTDFLSEAMPTLPDPRLAVVREAPAHEPPCVDRPETILDPYTLKPITE
ncbi:hypothetical protein [Mesorhizobium sp.]|uniref:hypothetical protein n=1 Tax=Mesorhizobium sp. TaxID=1871066 RepID=UPI000FE532FD|nr:hypothetical protein [Mesorhizobium sp.]RWO89549.1 MAG: hypothetical protein EOQ96_05155 [Mesorhizobium sp.]